MELSDNQKCPQTHKRQLKTLALNIIDDFKPGIIHGFERIFQRDRRLGDSQQQEVSIHIYVK